MSQSNWLHRIAIGGFLAALAWGAQAQQPQQPANPPERQQQADPSADLSGTFRALFKEAVEIMSREKAEAANTEKRKEDREESDLAAQWAQTLWASVAALAAALSLGVGSVTLYFLWRTFKEAKKTADAAIDAAKAAHASLRAMEANARLELRAYVYVKKVNCIGERARVWNAQSRAVVDGNTKYYRLSAELENSGGTPTRHCASSVNHMIRDDPLPADFDFPDSGIVEKLDVPPQTILHTIDVVVSPAVMSRITKKEKRLFFWGWVDYNDVFTDTQRHRTEFAMEVTAEEPIGLEQVPFAFLSCDRFNAADSDCVRQPKSYDQY